MYRSPSEKGEGAKGAGAYPEQGIGIHMVCFPRQYLMREPVLNQPRAGTRGAKEPRSDYLGGRVEVSHLLLGGRAEKMAYKQRVQVEEEFCRCFPAYGGEWKNLNERDPGKENKIQEYSEGRNPSRESGRVKCCPSGKVYPSAYAGGFFISCLLYLSSVFPFGKNSLNCLFMFSTFGFWFDT